MIHLGMRRLTILAATQMETVGTLGPRCNFVAFAEVEVVAQSPAMHVCSNVVTTLQRFRKEIRTFTFALAFSLVTFVRLAFAVIFAFSIRLPSPVMLLTEICRPLRLRWIVRRTEVLATAMGGS